VRSATLVREVDLEKLELAVEPLGFASRAEVAITAGLLAESVGLVGRRDRPAQLGERFYLRVSPGTVGLRVRTIWDATEGYAGRRAVRGVRIERGKWAGRAYAGESAGKDRRRQHLLDDGWAAREVERAAGVLRAGFGEVTVCGPAPAVRRRVKRWSRRSRERMGERVAELDYAEWMAGPGMLGMLTLTLPGWWEVLAPDGCTFKALVAVLRDRWRNARDETGQLMKWRCIWKLEFQRRGAPHLHALMKVPAMVMTDGGYGWKLGYSVPVMFEEWVARTWADICLDSLSERDALAYIDLGEYDKHFGDESGHPGASMSFSGVKYSDPRRTAIYFSKHASKSAGSKEYQHVVPVLWQHPDAGPGRFWGYSGLRRAVAEVELDEWSALRAKRVLRHVARARQAATALGRLRSAGYRDEQGVLVGLANMRRPRRRGGFGATAGGWVLVNAALCLAWDVGRHLAQT